jgi:rhodanese-related sulfurtransferase
MAVKTISCAEVVRLRRDGKPMVFIDVRTPGEYAGLHAEGARSVPLDQLDVAALSRADGEPVYVICQSGGRASRACERLLAAGLTDVYNVEGGTTAWERAGLPVVRGVGRKVISLERQVRIAAGTLVLAGLAVGGVVRAGFLGLSAFVGAGLVFAGVTDWCGMGLLLARMPWNRQITSGGEGASPK